MSDDGEPIFKKEIVSVGYVCKRHSDVDRRVREINVAGKMQMERPESGESAHAASHKLRRLAFSCRTGMLLVVVGEMYE